MLKLLSIFLLAVSLFGQGAGTFIPGTINSTLTTTIVNVDPSGVCFNPSAAQLNYKTGAIWGCKFTPPTLIGAWTQLNPSGGTTVTSVNGLTGVVTLSIPTDNSQIGNGAGYATVAQVPGLSAVTSVNTLTGAVTLAIPVNTSDLVNDSGFIASTGAVLNAIPKYGSTTAVNSGLSDDGTTITSAENVVITPGQVTLGANGGSIGKTLYKGNTSGVVTVQPQAAAGTPIVTFGSSSGTPVVTASSPLAITTATGNATCATCATTTNGGALSATSPLALSAAGVSSCPTCATTTNGGALSAALPLSISAAGGISTTNVTAGDNSIITSAVDASGNPSFLGTAANTVLPINGGTTSLVMYIAGLKQTLSSNVTLTLPTTVSVQQWVLAKQDTANAAMVAADFVGMNTAPFYGYAAPTCPSPTPALSATNPAYWFDMAAGLSKLCTSNAGAYSASPSIVLGVVNINATPAISAALAEPLRLSPHRRVELFGNGSDGTVLVTAGTTTVDGQKQYASLTVTGGTLTHTANLTTPGMFILSQNPVMIIGGTVSVAGKGRSASVGTTGAGATGGAGGIGASGGGGGGSGTTSAAGGAGGNRTASPLFIGGTAGGGTAGAATPTAGGAGTSVTSPFPRIAFFFPGCVGSSGGSGAGDGTNTGGQGGTGGGNMLIQAPAIFVASGISVVADGNAGGNAAGGNAAAGGGGGAGCNVLNAGYISASGATITAAGGASGTKAGTGQLGGVGGDGIAQQNKLW